MELRAPPAPSGAPTEEPAEPAEENVRPLPEGPILFLSRRTDEDAGLVPVAELQGDSLRPLPREMADVGYARRFVRERMGPGAEFVLFAQGKRVGTLEVGDGEAGTDSSFCAPRPRATGIVELLPSASSVQSFLALEPEVGSRAPRSAYISHSSTYDQRVASLNLVGTLIPQVGAIWPPSVLEARRDIQVFELQGSRMPAIAATFAYRDALRTGSAPEPAYSLFFIASHDGSAYRPTYVWYRDYARDGKGVPRYVTHLDWDQDGSDEVLLEVFGETHRWLAAAGTRNGSWETVYQDPCGRPGGGGPTAPE